MARKRHATARKGTTPGGGFDSEVLRHVGLAVRVARVARGFSQRELAEKAGRSQNLIWRLESGKHDPGIALLARLADELDMPLEFFVLTVKRVRPDIPRSKARDIEEGREVLMSLLEGIASWADADDVRQDEKKRKPNS